MDSRSKQITASGRIPELDGLRGIAVLLIISFHYINNQLTHAQLFVGKLLSQLTSFGWVGVDLFFVLSGFLIGNILIRNKSSKNFFSTFYVRRVVRIIPNYYLLILIFLLLRGIPYFLNNYFLTGANVIPWWSYFLMFHNFYMARMHSLGNDAMSVTWSIGIEEQFYIIFPFIVYFIKDRWLLVVLISAIIIAPFVRMQYNHWIPQYVLLPCRMDSIAFGILVAWLDRHYSIPVIVKKRIVILSTLIIVDCLICAYLFYRYSDLGVFKNTLFAFFFAGCLVLALTYKDSLYGRFLRNRMLIWVGTISYSLYLFHYLILGICQYLINHYGGLLLNSARDVLVTIFAFCLSLLFAWIVYRKLEKPFVLLGKKFAF